MKQLPQDFANSTQLSRWFYYTEEHPRERDYSSSLYPHMLIEDIRLGILPIGFPRHPSGVVIRLNPPNNNLEQMLCQALENSHREARHLDEAVDRFIDDVAGTLAYYGEGFYELVYFYDEFPHYKSFKFKMIPNWGLKKGLFSYIQHLPKQRNNDRKETIRRVRIPKENVVHFKLPGGIFVPRHYRKLLGRLGKLSDRPTPIKFTSPEQQGIGFDFSDYHSKEMLEVAHSTRKIGWYARQLYRDQTNEFYFIYRHLKFQLYKARLREQIIKTLNKALERVGNKINFNSKIIVEGVSSSTDTEKIINDLINGKIEFSTAIEKSKVE